MLAVDLDTHILTDEDVRDGSLAGFLAKVLLDVISILQLVQSRHATISSLSQLTHTGIGVRTRRPLLPSPRRGLAR